MPGFLLSFVGFSRLVFGVALPAVLLVAEFHVPLTLNPDLTAAFMLIYQPSEESTPLMEHEVSSPVHLFIPRDHRELMTIGWKVAFCERVLSPFLHHFKCIDSMLDDNWS